MFLSRFQLDFDQQNPASARHPQILFAISVSAELLNSCGQWQCLEAMPISTFPFSASDHPWDQPFGGPSAPWAIPSPDGRHLAIYSWSLNANMQMIENS
jgi:hypothetical protein